MKKSSVYAVILATLPMLIGVGITLFYSSDKKLDVYLFYNHARFIDNIFYDVSNLLTFSIFSYFASKHIRMLTPFFYISLIQWLLYFTIYKQFVSVVTIPLLILFLVICQKTKK